MDIHKLVDATMRKFLIFFILLIIAAVGISLLLPRPPAGLQTTDNDYQVEQASLFTPIPMEDLLLITPIPNDAQFTLRLGLYSELTMAVESVKSMKANNKVVIVKAIDKNREWYLVLHGQYANRNKAEQDKQWLQSNQLSSTLMLWPSTIE